MFLQQQRNSYNKKKFSQQEKVSCKKKQSKIFNRVKIIAVSFKNNSDT